MATFTLASPLAGTVLLLLFLYYLTGYVRFRTKYRFPAVVRGIPLFGNIFQVPKDEPRLYFQQLAKNMARCKAFHWRPMHAVFRFDSLK